MGCEHSDECFDSIKQGKFFVTYVTKVSSFFVMSGISERGGDFVLFLTVCLLRVSNSR